MRFVSQQTECAMSSAKVYFSVHGFATLGIPIALHVCLRQTVFSMFSSSSILFSSGDHIKWWYLPWLGMSSGAQPRSCSVWSCSKVAAPVGGQIRDVAIGLETLETSSEKAKLTVTGAVAACFAEPKCDVDRAVPGIDFQATVALTNILCAQSVPRAHVSKCLHLD